MASNVVCGSCDEPSNSPSVSTASSDDGARLSLIFSESSPSHDSESECLTQSHDDDSLLWHNHQPRTSSSLTCKKPNLNIEPRTAATTQTALVFNLDFNLIWKRKWKWRQPESREPAGSDDMSHCPTLLSMLSNGSISTPAFSLTCSWVRHKKEPIPRKLFLRLILHL